MMQNAALLLFAVNAALAQTCEDARLPSGGEWFDVDGSPHNCAWYSMGNRCETIGHLYRNHHGGLTANQACCVCGGGSTGAAPVVPSTPAPPVASPCGTRQRKAWSSLSCSERALYIEAVATFKDTRTQEYTDIVSAHSTAWNIAHLVRGAATPLSSFLPWHRWYINGWENALRSLGGKFACITLPYWDWDSDFEDARQSSVLREDTFGSADGTAPWWRWGRAGCVNQGLADYRQGWEISDGSCLRRTFDSSIPSFTSEASLADLIQQVPDFETFSNVLEGRPHGLPHMFVGGSMATQASPEDPLFMLHHANVDRIWAIWQDFHGYTKISKEDTTRTHYHPMNALDDVLPFPTTKGGRTLPYFPVATIRDMLHLDAMPYGSDATYGPSDNLAFVLDDNAARWSWFTPTPSDPVECTASRHAQQLDRRTVAEGRYAYLAGLTGPARAWAIDAKAKADSCGKAENAISAVAKAWLELMGLEDKFVSACSLLRPRRT